MAEEKARQLQYEYKAVCDYFNVFFQVIDNLYDSQRINLFVIYSFIEL